MPGNSNACGGLSTFLGQAIHRAAAAGASVLSGGLQGATANARYSSVDHEHGQFGARLQLHTYSDE